MTWLLTQWKALSVAWKVIVAVLIAMALLWAYSFVSGLFVGTKGVEAKLGTEQADAAIESGQDAVNTVGENEQSAAETDDKVGDVQDDVDEATDSASATDAGLDGLCAYFGVGCEE